MYSILENMFVSKDLYQSVMAPVCEKYDMTQTEMTVLLFLKNNNDVDTATDIVKRRGLTKSSVSAAVRTLTDNGYLTGKYTEGNHRTIHLALSEKADNIVKEGLYAQEKFFEIITCGFSEKEKQSAKNFIMKITENITKHNHVN